MNNDRILATAPKGKSVAKDRQSDELLLTLYFYCRTLFGKLRKPLRKIIPLAEAPERRSNATNPIALSTLYSKAVGLHLILFDENFKLMLSEKVKAQARMK